MQRCVSTILRPFSSLVPSRIIWILPFKMTSTKQKFSNLELVERVDKYAIRTVRGLAFCFANVKSVADGHTSAEIRRLTSDTWKATTTS
jgi:hypothetical protein